MRRIGKSGYGAEELYFGATVHNNMSRLVSLCKPGPNSWEGLGEHNKLIWIVFTENVFSLSLA